MLPVVHSMRGKWGIWASRKELLIFLVSLPVTWWLSRQVAFSLCFPSESQFKVKASHQWGLIWKWDPCHRKM